MKSNIEYLKEDIAKAEFMPVAFKNQLIEWVDAIEEEKSGNEKIEDLKEELLLKESEIDELQEEIEGYQKNWIDPDNVETIDCGIGEIKYIQPDNLKLQCLMEDFKEQHELSKQTLLLFQ